MILVSYVTLAVVPRARRHDIPGLKEDWARHRRIAKVTFQSGLCIGDGRIIYVILYHLATGV
jgi:uncharacterized membrane protein YozB (DUF420 family)